VVGTDDPLVKPGEAKRLAAKSACGLPLIVPGAGHIESYKVLGADNYVNQILAALEGRLKKCI